MAGKDRQARVGLDATPLLTPRSGVGEFCYWAMAALAARGDIDVRAFAVTWRRRGLLDGKVPPGVTITGRAMPARPLHKSWAWWPLPPIETFVGQLDVVHGTNFVVPPARRAAMVVTVHDLTPLHFPQMCQAATLAFPALVRQAVRRGAWVHTPTRFVAEEVVELLGAPPQRVRAVAHGIPSLGLRPATGAAPEALVREGLGAPLEREAAKGPPRWREHFPPWVERFVLAVGTVEPRKDYPGLVRAFDAIADRHPGVALAIAGADGWGADALEEVIAASHARDRVVRLGRVSDDERQALLAEAAVLAYPSVYEGFGLPPLEAMAAGTPVVASRTGALEETLGDAARLVEQGDVDALAEALDEVLDSPALAAALAENGRLEASRYSWEACAQGLVTLYADALAERRH